jgi:hypothetical protein
MISNSSQNARSRPQSPFTRDFMQVQMNNSNMNMMGSSSPNSLGSMQLAQQQAMSSPQFVPNGPMQMPTSGMNAHFNGQMTYPMAASSNGQQMYPMSGPEQMSPTYQVPYALTTPL